MSAPVTPREVVDAVLAWRWRELNGRDDADDLLGTLRDVADRYIKVSTGFSVRNLD